MPKTSHNPLLQRMHVNIKIKCKVDGCTNYRTRVSCWCMSHDKKMIYHGHPLAQRIPKQKYAVERELVLKILELNMSHPAIMTAIDFITSWIKQSQSQYTTTPCSKFVCYLDRVSPYNLFVELASVWHFAAHHPTDVLSDKHLQYLLGNKFLRFGGQNPESVNIRGHHHRDVGRFIVQNIGISLINVSRAIDEHEAKQNQRLSDMAKPLST
jgi:hypothetical protein